jgi:hypothetical protein
MLGSDWARRVGTAAVTVWLAGGGPTSAEEIRNWPCALPLAERFAAEKVWGGPLPAPLPDGWRENAAAQEVVVFAANPENPPAQGEARIAAFADRVGAGRQAALLDVFAGLLEEFNALRGYVIEGVRDFVVRAKILEEAIDKNEAALAALPADGGPELEQQRNGYLDARAFDARSQDDALEEAEFLCRRYAYLDQKLRSLTTAIRAAL